MCITKHNSVHQLFIYLSLFSKFFYKKKLCTDRVQMLYGMSNTLSKLCTCIEICFSIYWTFPIFFLPRSLQPSFPFLRVQINPRCNVKALVLLFPKNLSLGLCLKYLNDINIHFLLYSVQLHWNNPVRRLPNCKPSCFASNNCKSSWRFVSFVSIIMKSILFYNKIFLSLISRLNYAYILLL